MTDEIPQCLLCGEAGIAGVLNICGDCYDKKIKRNDCQGEGPEFVERAEIARLQAELNEARETLKGIAVQRLFEEMTEDEQDDACFSDGYDEFIIRARAFLTKGETDNG